MFLAYFQLKKKKNKISCPLLFNLPENILTCMPTSIFFEIFFSFCFYNISFSLCGILQCILYLKY